MKKGILLIASAAALVLGSNNAFAAAPNWYNFQGVCLEQNATVTVQFDIVNANGDAIYSEVHSGVQTNASGIFTLHVGQGSALEGAMPSNAELYKGGLVLITNVNGVEVSRAALGAVPYASNAAALGEYTAEDITNLGAWVEELSENIGSGADAEKLAELDDAVYEISSDVQGIQDALQQKAPITKVVDLEDAVAEISSDVQGLQEATRGLAPITKVVELEDAVAEISSDVQGLQEATRGLAPITKVVDLDEALAEVSSDVQGIQEALQQKAPITMLTELQEYVMEQIGDEGTIVKTITWLSNAINDIEENYVTTESLDASMANFQENIENALKAYVTTEDLDASMANFQENIENALKAYVTTEDLDASMANFQENIENALKAYVTTEDLDISMNNFQENIEMALKAYVTTEDLDASMDNFQENIANKFTEVESTLEEVSTIVNEQIGDEGQIHKSILNLSNIVLELEARIDALEAK